MSTCETGRKPSLVWLAYNVTFASFATGRDQTAQSKLGLAVSGNFFDVLELQPALGRAIRPDEDHVPGRDAVVVLAYDTWTEQFGSDPGVIGRQIRLGGLDFTVVGVAPRDFHRHASGSSAGVHHSHRHVVEARRRSARHAARTAQLPLSRGPWAA